MQPMKMVCKTSRKKSNPVETWTRSPWCFVLFVPHAFKYQAAIVMWGWYIDMSDPFHFSDQALRHSHKRNRYPKSTGWSSSYGEIAKNLDTTWDNFPIFRHRIIMFLKNPRNYPRFHEYIMTSMPYKKTSTLRLCVRRSLRVSWSLTAIDPAGWAEWYLGPTTWLDRIGSRSRKGSAHVNGDLILMVDPWVVVFLWVMMVNDGELLLSIWDING
jgi:hypothetical protein